MPTKLTENQRNEKCFTIAVEGNIGSGKIDHFKKKFSLLIWHFNRKIYIFGALPKAKQCSSLHRTRGKMV